MSEVEKMTLFSEKKDDNKNNISNKIPDWIDLDANESIEIHLLIDSDYEFDILYAVRESKLPCEVIDFLTGDKNPIKMLTKAGFGIGRTSGVDNAILEAFVFKEVLGVHTKNFLNIIAPYVYPDSYIKFMTEDGLYYKWQFYDSICYKVDLD